MVFHFTFVTTAPRHLLFSGGKKTEKFELCAPMIGTTNLYLFLQMKKKKNSIYVRKQTNFDKKII